ncbi:uncharacterized protein [Panulirus ornatus]
MCWNTCGILRHHVSVWSSMCTDHTACFPGCQVACGFYMDKSLDKRGSATPYQSTPPPQLPAYLPPPRISGRNQVIWDNPDWPGSATPFSQGDIIYVLLMHGDGGWREIAQTSSTSALIPRGMRGIHRARLLAVSQQGLEAVSEVYLHLNDVSKGHPHAGDTLDYEDPLHEEEMPSSVVPYGYKLNPVRTQPPSLPDDPDSDTKIKIPHHTSVSSDLPDSSTSHVYDSFSLLTLGYTPDLPADQSHPKVANSYNSDKSPHVASVDPSWIIQVVDLHLDTLAEVTVAWEPRGSGEVEYLLSWVEESGFVSGHLLTNQVTSELSLWPGQGYRLQVELIDSQGNAVLKSIPTPVIFHPSPPTSSATTKSNPVSTTTFSSVNTLKMEETFTTTLTTVQSENFEDVGRVSDKRLLKHGTVPLSPFLKGDDPHNFMQSDADEVTDKHYGHSASHGGSSETKERIQEENIGYREIAKKTGDKIPAAEVSATEILTTATSERASQVMVWCVGVGIGALLLLTLSSMVIWLLGRCRKSTQNEEYTECGQNAYGSSFREEVAQQNLRNQTTSWTFENFCSTSRKSKFVSQRKEVVPVGIDNASLVENYVIMLESPPSGSKIRC